jgi:nucleotide-binding universal stress UspA family protein
MRGHVFISYSHAHDGAYVELLAAHLEQEGVTVWFDRDIVTGDRWDEVIREKIDTSVGVIVVMSPAAEALFGQVTARTRYAKA